jgi:hypothetical protein
MLRPVSGHFAVSYPWDGMDLAAADIERLRELELSLWQAPTCFDSDYMNRVLAEDFTEFGRSGRVYAREDTLAVPPQPIDARLTDMAFRALGESAALVTYRTHVRDGEETLVGNRSSVWSRAGAGWQLRFHQGTPAPEKAQVR